MITKTKSIYPVAVNEVKQHLRITVSEDEDDGYIGNYIIKAATRKAENFIGYDIALTSNVLTTYDFNSDEITIKEGNFVSLDFIISDASVSLSYDHIEESNDRFYIDFGYTIDSDPLIIQYTTGFSNPDDVPEDIKQAILIECANLYDVEKSSYTQGSYKKSDIFERLLMPHKLLYW